MDNIVQRIHNEIEANSISVANKCQIFLFSNQEQNLQDLWIVHDRYTTEGGWTKTKRIGGYRQNT